MQIRLPAKNPQQEVQSLKASSSFRPSRGMSFEASSFWPGASFGNRQQQQTQQLAMRVHQHQQSFLMQAVLARKFRDSQMCCFFMGSGHGGQPGAFEHVWIPIPVARQAQSATFTPNQAVESSEAGFFRHISTQPRLPNHAFSGLMPYARPAVVHSLAKSHGCSCVCFILLSYVQSHAGHA